MPPSALLHPAAVPWAADPSGLAAFFREFWPVLLPVALGLASVYLLLPRARRYPPLWGALLGAAALVLAGWLWIRAEPDLAETILFYAFSAVAVIAGGLLVTQSNPVRAALSFALVVLSTCGLFLLQAAPFLMAATIIIYAGAIVVTFLFVLMLAQQEGPSDADQRSREPLLATVAGFVLLGGLLCVLHRAYDTSRYAPLEEYFTRAAEASRADSMAAIEQAVGGDVHRFCQEFVRRVDALLVPPPPGRAGQTLGVLKDAIADADQTFTAGRASLNAKRAMFREVADKRAQLLYARGSLQPSGKDLPLSPYSGLRPNLPVKDIPRDRTGRPIMPAANVQGLGRALFTDYLLAVELAGTLLLVATIGAIAIAGRRTEGLR